eukprot:753779-Hanusia_phi.AAC.3
MYPRLAGWPGAARGRSLLGVRAPAVPPGHWADHFTAVCNHLSNGHSRYKHGRNGNGDTCCGSAGAAAGSPRDVSMLPASSSKRSRLPLSSLKSLSVR